MSFLRINNLLVNSRYIISILHEKKGDPWLVKFHSDVGLGNEPIEVKGHEVLKLLEYFGISSNEIRLQEIICGSQ